MDVGAEEVRSGWTFTGLVCAWPAALGVLQCGAMEMM